MTSVQPQPIIVTTKVYAPTITIRPHLWLKWAKIAIRQEGRARDARAQGAVMGNRFGLNLGLEVEDSIQAVAAVRHCLHNLWLVWRDILNADRLTNGGPPLEREKQLTPSIFTTELPPNIKEWKARVRSLIGQRDMAVHHEEESAPPVPHPFYPTNVAGLDAAFSYERSREAVDLMMDVFARAMVSPSPALIGWANANSHVLGLLERMRTTGEDF